MIKTFHIKNFRGIEELKIPNISRVNLVLGQNNCGKTSVLEALMLLSAPSQPITNQKVNILRSFKSQNLEDLKFNFHQMDNSKPIEFECTFDDGSSRLVKNSLFIEYSSILDNNANFITNSKDIVAYGWETIFFITDSNGKTEVYSAEKDLSPLKEGIRAKILDPIADEKLESYKELMKCSFFTNSLSFNYVTLASILVSKQEHILIKALKVIEPKIKNITLIGDRVMVDLGDSKLVPINLLGDGVRKVFSIMLALYQSENGILLIDEIDNGLHYRSMKILWDVVLTMAREHNVQVFTTTHNVDSLKGLQKKLSETDFEDYRKDISVYTLRRLPENKMKVYQYLYESFDYAINQEIEIR
ncbi:MAG: AAA family ATPase [Parabacteroides sp.]|nr:AAA family ATPase [Parabacteroides sp.]